MRAVFAGGGSGGHLYPGLAVADELRRRDPLGIEIRFLATSRPIDRIILDRSGFAWEPLPAIRDGRPSRLGTFLRAAPVFGTALRRIRELRPDVVIGLGGYGSVPPCLAAASLRIPVFLLEPNCIPGRANRLLSPLAREVWVQFGAVREGLPRGARVRVTGNPLRQGLQAVPAAGARVSLGLAASLPTLVILGGSQGASGVNRLATTSAPELRARCEGLQIFHLAGAADRDAVDEAYRRARIPARVEAFVDRMDLAYSAADVVVSRAGAGTLAELAAFGLPAVLVPYPHDRDRHQVENARAFERAGAAVVHLEGGEEGFAEAVLGILADRSRREGMAERCRRLGRPEAAVLAVHRLEHWERERAVRTP